MCLALLWFEEQDAPSGLAKGAKRMLNEEDGLNELTGFIDGRNGKIVEEYGV